MSSIRGAFLLITIFSAFSLRPAQGAVRMGDANGSGTVDLAEVKSTFGAKYSLRGNVNSITVMQNGTPEDVEKDIIRCMDAAKAGGGFILGVGDQAPYATPEENLYAFVESGRKYGKYG